MSEIEKNWETVCQLIFAHNNFSEPLQVRQKALEQLEQFREQSPYVIHVGFLLAEGTVHPSCQASLKLQCQQFGFGLLSSFIISRWIKTQGDDKILFKQKLVELVTEKLDNSWPRFIKDACAKVVVELAKREWPQTWPDFVQTLYNVASRSTAHETLVLMIYLRLAEDIFELDSLLTLERRRDLRYSIVQTFENGLLEHIIGEFEKLNLVRKQQNNLDRDQEILLNVVIDTMNEYLSWLPANAILKFNSRLIPLFLESLQINPLEIKTKLVGCLTNLFQNECIKGKPTLLDFFCDPLFETFQAVTGQADYDFFKATTRFFCALSPHIISLWDSVKTQNKLDIAFKYFTFLLEMSKNPSQSISSMTMDMWIRLLRNLSVKQSEPMKKIIPELIPVLRQRMLKVGLPSLNNHVACAYNKQDFTSDDEFSQFFNRMFHTFF